MVGNAKLTDWAMVAQGCERLAKWSTVGMVRVAGLHMEGFAEAGVGWARVGNSQKNWGGGEGVLILRVRRGREKQSC
jgi:hypothetical protein